MLLRWLVCYPMLIAVVVGWEFLLQRYVLCLRREYWWQIEVRDSIGWDAVARAVLSSTLTVLWLWSLNLVVVP